MIQYLATMCNLQTRLKGSWLIGIAILLSTAALFGVTACTQLTPYRTVLNKSNLVTSNDLCASEEAKMTPEITKDYELNFVEFDDQGWLHPVGIKENGDADKNGDAYKQLDFLMDRLHQKMQKKDSPEISIILYIHGWKHNADCKDGNVVKFRQVLQDVSQLEQKVAEPYRKPPRKIVGIYVGWRGQSLNWPLGLDNTTFWDRKATALRVAQGSARELLVRLRGFQRNYNGNDCKPDPEHPSMRPNCKVRMLLIGHSFGGWILYSATSGWLIQSVAANIGVDGEKDINSEPANAAERFADMVVLINPAFEASRYEPLHRVAQCQPVNAPDSAAAPNGANSPCPFQFRQYDHYEAPLLVTVTSETDAATGTWFPIGRKINSILEPTASSEQHEAITHTPGHIDRYITHELAAGKDPCTDANYETEEAKEHEFFLNNQDKTKNNKGYSLKPDWEHKFCGGAVLTHRPNRSDPNSPVWNVRAAPSIIDGHNDIERPAFIAFIRQLYHELVSKSSSENSGPAANAMTGTGSLHRSD